MDGFDQIAPWKDLIQRFMNIREQRDYAAYWIDNSPDQVADLIAHPLFPSQLDSLRSFSYEYPEIVERLYGSREHVLFPELGRRLSGIALAELARRISMGELLIPTCEPTIRKDLK
jgi:hypothetical protein